MAIINHSYGRRVIHLSNPTDPNKPFAMVENKAPTIYWSSCYSTGGGGSGGGGGGSNAGGIIATPHWIFKYNDGYTNGQMRTLESEVAFLNKAGAALLAAGGVVTIAAAAAALGFGVVVAAGMIFLAGGIITISLAQFVKFVTSGTVFYVTFSKPCVKDFGQGKY